MVTNFKYAVHSRSADNVFLRKLNFVSLFYVKCIYLLVVIVYIIYYSRISIIYYYCLPGLCFY